MGTNLWAGRVVVGVDASEQARQAAVWAAREAALHHVGLTLVHTVLPPAAASSFGPGMPVGLDAMEEIVARATAELDAIASTLPVTDVRTRVEIGSPSGALLEASEEAELVVLGSRGHGGFTGLLLGSVSTQVAAHATCPVIVVRGAPDPAASRVVVGIDGSPASEAALAFAFEEASRHGWSLTAVHAWDVPAYDLLVVPNAPVPVPLSDVADDEIRLAAEALAGFEADYPDVEVEQRLIRAAAVDALLDVAQGAALIVVGTRGHGQVVGALLGSVSNGVLHKATIPVAVVPFTPPERSVA